MISSFDKLTQIAKGTIIHDEVNVVLCLLTIDELNDMIMFETFHNGDFTL